MKAIKSIGALLIVRSNGFPEAEKVYDADKTVIIEVAGQDNRRGVVFDRNKCAFARAACRAMHCDGAIIGKSVSFLIKDNTALRYKNSETLIREIVSFDRKAGFDVGYYRLSPFSPSSRLGAPRAPAKKNSKTSRNHKKAEEYRHFTQGVRTLQRGGVDEEVRP